MRTLLLLMAAVLLTGCAIVTIEGASAPQHFIHIGRLSVYADKPDSVIVSTFHGIGATMQDEALNIGYVKQEKVQILEPERCHLILVIQSSKEAEQIKDALGNLMKNACTNKPKSL